MSTKDVKLCDSSCFYHPENEGQAKTFRDMSTDYWYHENELVDIIGTHAVNKIKKRHRKTTYPNHE